MNSGLPMHARGLRGTARVARVVLALALAIALPVCAQASSPARSIAEFDDPSAWKLETSAQVKASLHTVPGTRANALCIDFDFGAANGYARLTRELDLDPPDDYVIEFEQRGDAPSNQLLFKLLDSTGRHVWWYTEPEFKPAPGWRTVTIRKREFEPPWDPTDAKTRHRVRVEIGVSRGEEAGRGSVCFDRLRLRESTPSEKLPAPVLTASSFLSRYPAGYAMDGNQNTSWRSDPRAGAAQHLQIDFGEPRDFGGLVVLHWVEGLQATHYDIQVSGDASHWTTLRHVADGRIEQPLLLPDGQPRFVRLQLQRGASSAYGLKDIEVKKDLAWGVTNAVGYAQELAKVSPRGYFPRGLSGEQPYWTVVGVDGGAAKSALLSEDGALEIGKGGFTLEPFLIADGELVSWGDVKTAHRLQEGYLPIPSVRWDHPRLQLDVTSFARGTKDRSRLFASYRVTNPSARTQTVTLALVARPFRVGPPTQWLGGLHPIRLMEWNGRGLAVDGRSVIPLQRPNAFVASAADPAALIEDLAVGKAREHTRLVDTSGWLNGALLFELTLPPRASRTVGVVVPLAGDGGIPHEPEGQSWLEREHVAAASEWRFRLNRIGLQLPPAGKPIADTLRSALAQILISRNGAALQPGTRAYSRSWIRDGAMMTEALVRMREAGPAGDFLRWFAAHQAPDGYLPCCVDGSGPDTLVENDAYGEFVFAVEQVRRYTQDRQFAADLWPQVRAAMGHMEGLRQSERSAANRDGERRAFWGLMPVSVAHEGYIAKPVHAYWDDFWALRGYKDAVSIASALGHAEEEARYAAQRDEFRNELYESLKETATQHGIDYLAGAAELGDFDAPAPTIAIAPGGELGHLPRGLVDNTFERYWRDFVARRDGRRTWEDYVPYEMRLVGTFVHLGQRERAHEALKFFFEGQRPPGWNQWAEVVGRDVRKPRFVGDMPHAWVSGDFIRIALDMFAYEREQDHALVLAAGVPMEWLDAGVALSGLATPYGQLGYRIGRKRGGIELSVARGTELPPGGFVLPWPGVGPLPRATINGRPAAWRARELSIREVPATVVLGAR